MPCKNYSLGTPSQNSSSSFFGTGLRRDEDGEIVVDLGLETVATTEMSWMSPLQYESEQLEKVSLLTRSINSTTLFALKKATPEADEIFTNPFFIFVTALSCFGNLAIICLICSFPKFRKPANLLIANLSVSSLLLMVSVNIRYMEFSMDLWTYSSLWCRTLACLHRIPVPLVALTTMAISFDRGRVARNPLTRTCSMNPFWRVIFIWSFSLLIAAPLGVSRKFDPCISNPYKCSKTLLFSNMSVTIMYAILFLFSVYIIPSMILVQESTKTLRKIRFLRASIVTWSENRIGVQIFPTFPDTRLRLLRNSCTFSVIFLVFWLPYGFAQFFLDLPQNLLPDILVAYTQFYVKVLKNFTYIQVMMNPVILFMLSYDFGTYCQRFKMKCPTLV
ncbi:galanin receptor 2a-like isoform X2 [Folsomia candida]|uniref:Opsin, ultraviolet-sensitive n=1 Tax=Folsomia candida TaxID=158441 RepID=A0A226DYJ3_FOLCA|nr:galanin receptor 2a-like isoform X2 [Folsomia candida]OXA50299.1 Opsin, ultraviolet-sensitive [Folsomia candida]